MDLKQIIEDRKKWLHEIETQDNRATAKPIIIALQLRREYPARDGYRHDGEWTKDGEGEDLPEPIPFAEHWEDEQHFFTYSALQEHLRINRHNYPQNRDYVKYAFRNREWQEIPRDFKLLIDHIATLEAQLERATQSSRKDRGGDSEDLTRNPATP